MTDVPLARAEIEALIVMSKAGRAYAQTAVASAMSAENVYTAVITRAENALTALESEKPSLEEAAVLAEQKMHGGG